MEKMMRSVMEAGPPLKQKVLIVDDSPTSLKVLGELLKADYAVYVATSGKAALEKAVADPPDLILLDIIMSDLDGYEVCRRLKAEESTKDIPVIFITAKSEEDDEVRGLALGAVDYITKPFRLPIVKARVQTHLELKRKTDILESISSKDGLTGIFNRRQFDTVFTVEWKRALRNKRPLAVIMIDIDCFKLYNDNYGHQAGDECLKAVARTLSDTLQRASDFVARYGGEEFVVILPETDPDTAFFIGKKLRSSVAALKIEHSFSTVAPYVTVSVGVASAVPALDMDSQTLLELADNALYEAKQSGRNRVTQK